MAPASVPVAVPTSTKTPPLPARGYGRDRPASPKGPPLKGSSSSTVHHLLPTPLFFHHKLLCRTGTSLRPWAGHSMAPTIADSSGSTVVPLAKNRLAQKQLRSNLAQISPRSVVPATTVKESRCRGWPEQGERYKEYSIQQTVKSDDLRGQLWRFQVPLRFVWPLHDLFPGPDGRVISLPTPYFVSRQPPLPVSITLHAPPRPSRSMIPTAFIICLLPGSIFHFSQSL